MDNARRLHRLSTRRYIPRENEVLRVLIHLLSWVLRREGSWIYTWSMTIIVMPGCECKSLLKWATTGETLVLPCKMAERLLLILQRCGRPVSPNYCWPHLLHVIRYITLEDLQKALIITANCSPGESIRGLQYRTGFVPSHSTRLVAGLLMQCWC